jgi:hypothetical protein
MQLRLSAGLSHQPVSSGGGGGGNGGSPLQKHSLQRNSEADANAGATHSEDMAASPANAERSSTGGHMSQPVASLPAPPHAPGLASNGGKLRGAQRRKPKRPAQKSGEAAAHQQTQRQPHANLMQPSAEEAAELQLSDGEDSPAAGSRHRQQHGTGTAEGLTGPWKPLPANSGGQLTAAVAAAAAGPEPIPLETSSATTSGGSPGRDAPAADSSVQQRLISGSLQSASH